MDNEHICRSFKESRVDNYDVVFGICKFVMMIFFFFFFFFFFLVRQLSILSDLVLAYSDFRDELLKLLLFHLNTKKKKHFSVKRVKRVMSDDS
jgi:hypothetical protein